MKKVLIVEDDSVNRKLLNIILTGGGYDTMEAVDGQYGVESAQAWLPDIIFMDIQMPRVDGLKAVAMLKEDEATRAIPVIAITAFAMKEDQQRILNGGFDDYITKPADIDHILKIAAKYCPA